MMFLYGKVLYVIKQHAVMRSKTRINSKLNNNDKSNRDVHLDASLMPLSTDEHAHRDQMNLSVRHHQQQQQQQIGHREITAEVHVTRSLAILIACFILCWLPFFILYIIRAACRCLSFHAMEFSVWLGYSNSAINPVLYAVLNKNFRIAFRKIFITLKTFCYK